jgi:acyl carrier protein
MKTEAIDARALKKLLTIVSECLEVPLSEVSLSSTPDTISSWDSVRQLNVILAVEEEFNIQFSADEFARIGSVDMIAALVAQKTGDRQ